MDLWDDPERFAIREPYYSSVRHQPNGWTSGVAGTSEVERVFHETVSVAVRSGTDSMQTSKQVPRAIDVRWTERDSVRVTYSKRLRTGAWDGGILVSRASEEGWEGVNDSNCHGPCCANDPNTRPLLDSEGAATGMDIAGLRPGGRYRMSAHRADSSCNWGLTSEWFHLETRPQGPGVPTGPDGLSPHESGSDSIRLKWTDNSISEDGFEVWYRSWETPHWIWGETETDNDAYWQMYGDPFRRTPG